MRIIFMGTPDFAVPTLDALHAGGHDIAAVYTQPPRPAGRGKKERKSAVHMRAEALGLPVVTPESMKTDQALANFTSYQADIAVVIAYGHILPVPVLETPKWGCINVHASLLPRWRGAAPIHRAIMAGDTKTGVCIMRMEAGLDTGGVFALIETAIDPSDTTASLHDKLATAGADAIDGVLLSFENGGAHAVEQAAEGVTYAHKIDKSEARINWSKPAIEIDRQVRGLFPFPGAWFEHDGERIKILEGRSVSLSGTAGVLLDEALMVGCGTGGYQILRLQRAGKGPVNASEFTRGKPVAAGTVFS
ncbi:MAG: methionyl-tRNA formyltransferase [Kordiimonadales bacterium]|nr:MAG: methionyl-tRNA formyltransferase [Kordiimonadales bacterium]